MLTRRPPLKMVVCKMEYTTSAEETQLPPRKLDVAIRPSGKSNPQFRRRLDRKIRSRRYVQFSINSDGVCCAPGDFHQPTVRWALRTVRAVIIRADDRPARHPKRETNLALVRATLGHHVPDNGRVAIVNTIGQTQGANWLRYATRHCRPGTRITRFVRTDIVTEVTR
jgi:hypothetical protein